MEIWIDGFVVIVDESLEHLDWSKCKIVKNRNTHYALYRGYYLHRLIMRAQKGQLVDHINNNGLDNHVTNLRISNFSQNRQRGSIARGRSGYLGVTPQKSGWAAKVWFENKCIYLGYFKSPIEAARAYDRFALERWGVHAKTNFSF